MPNDPFSFGNINGGWAGGLERLNRNEVRGGNVVGRELTRQMPERLDQFNGGRRQRLEFNQNFLDGGAAGLGQPGSTISGVPDDSIGLGFSADIDAVREALVGPETDPQRLALIAASETPSYLRTNNMPRTDLISLAATLAAVASPGARERIEPKLSDERVAANLQVLTGSPINAALASRLLERISSNPSALSSTVISRIFAKTAPGSAEALAALAFKLDDAGLTSLGAFIEASPRALEDKDASGRTLLENLLKLSSLEVRSGVDGQELVRAVLAELANPNRVQQGEAPTCTVASMQYELATDAPSEYVRLVSGLASEGQVVMRGGALLKSEAADHTNAARGGRSISQALFQSAAMEHGNGPDADFDPVLGRSVTSGGHSQRGLTLDQQRGLLDQLFGPGYETYQLSTEAEWRDVLTELGTFTAKRDRPVVINLDQGSYNHAVTLEHIDNGQATYRDPYGALRTVTLNVLADYMVAIHMPRSLR